MHGNTWQWQTAKRSNRVVLYGLFRPTVGPAGIVTLQAEQDRDFEAQKDVALADPAERSYAVFSGPKLGLNVVVSFCALHDYFSRLREC